MSQPRLEGGPLMRVLPRDVPVPHALLVQVEKPVCRLIKETMAREHPACAGPCWAALGQKSQPQSSGV